MEETWPKQRCKCKIVADDWLKAFTDCACMAQRLHLARNKCETSTLIILTKSLRSKCKIIFFCQISWQWHRTFRTLIGQGQVTMFRCFYFWRSWKCNILKIKLDMEGAPGSYTWHTGVFQLFVTNVSCFWPWHLHSLH